MRTEAVNETQMGMLKAFHYLLKRSKNPPAPKPKFSYRKAGNVIHASRHLSADERARVTALAAPLAFLNPKNAEHAVEISKLLKQLSKEPVRFVPIKRQTPLKTSKVYPYRSTKRGG